jgi:hypothetical protein
MSFSLEADGAGNGLSVRILFGRRSQSVFGIENCEFRMEN